MEEGIIMVSFFYFIGKCCSVVAVRQEFRKKFLPKCVRWHALFVLKEKMDVSHKM